MSVEIAAYSSTFRYIEPDLRGIISEAASKKGIPHIRERTDKVLALMLANPDEAASNQVVIEIVSTLLLTAEVTQSHKILNTTVDILLKLCSSPGVIRGEIFSHVITVLGKAAYSLMSLISTNGEPAPSEVELGLLRCLQVVNLLQTESLREQFLNEVSLSQILAVCANLISRKAIGHVVSQTAVGVLGHIQLFILDAIASSTIPSPPIDPSNFSIPSGSTLSPSGEQLGVAHLFPSRPRESPRTILFSFIHDCITMSDPGATLQVQCILFGSSRIPCSLALEILTDLISKTPWSTDLSLIAVAKLYLMPLLSRRITTILGSDNKDQENQLAWFSLASIFFRSSLVPYCRHEVDKLVIVMNNFLSSNHRGDERLVLVMKSFSTGIVTSQNFHHIVPQIVTNPHSPLGGDSPVNSTRNRPLIESIIDNVALFIAQLFANIGPDIEERKKNFVESDIITPVQVITMFVSSLYRETLNGGGVVDVGNTLEITWAPILSVFQLILPLTQITDIQESFSNFFILLSLYKLRRGLSSATCLLVELPYDDFVLSVSSRLVDDNEFSMDLSDWSTLIRSLNRRGPEISIRQIFSSPRNLDKSTILVRSLIPATSKWTINRLRDVLLSSPGGLDNLDTLWKNFVGPSIENGTTNTNDPEDVVSLTMAVTESLFRSPQPLGESAVMQSIAFLSEKHPSKMSCPIISLIQNFGQNISEWQQIHNCNLFFGNESLKIIEIIIDEFLDINIPYIAEMSSRLSQLLPVVSTNKSFLIISLVHKCGKASPSFSNISSFFQKACLDSRMDVRNCAIKTLTSLNVSEIDFLIHITAEVYQQSCSPQDRSRDEEETAGLIVHHSQDTEEKRWAESVGCCLRMLSLASINNHGSKIILNSSEIEKIFFDIFSPINSSNLSPAAVQLFVDLISSTLNDPEIQSDDFNMLLNLLSQQINSSELLKVTQILVPKFMCLERIPDVFSNSVFKLFQKIVTTISGGKPVVNDSIIVTDDCNGICSVDFSILRIDSVILSMIGNTKIFFNRIEFLDFILGKDRFTTDSGTLHLGIKVIDLLTTQFEGMPNNILNHFVNHLERIASCHDSYGLWKYALEALVRMNQTDTLVTIFTSLVTDRFDPILYRMSTHLLTTDLNDEMNGKICLKILDFLKDFNYESAVMFTNKNHFIAYLVFIVLSSILQTAPPTIEIPRFDDNQFKSVQIGNLRVTSEFIHETFIFSREIISKKVCEESLTIPILSLLEKATKTDLGTHLLLLIFPAREMIMSENILVRESFSNIMSKYSPFITRQIISPIV